MCAPEHETAYNNGITGITKEINSELKNPDSGRKSLWPEEDKEEKHEIQK